VTSGRDAKSPPSVDEPALADRVVLLRSEGQSFAAIAKTVGLGRSMEAFTMFVDEVAQRPPAEQARLRAEENSRLDTLEARTRARTDADELDRKLEMIVELRQRLMAT
jgi:hypothetical protein